MASTDQYPWNKGSDESFDVEGQKTLDILRPSGGPAISRRELKNLYGLDQSYSQSRRVGRERFESPQG